MRFRIGLAVSVIAFFAMIYRLIVPLHAPVAVELALGVFLVGIFALMLVQPLSWRLAGMVGWLARVRGMRELLIWRWRFFRSC